MSRKLKICSWSWMVTVLINSVISKAKAKRSVVDFVMLRQKYIFPTSIISIVWSRSYQKEWMILLIFLDILRWDRWWWGFLNDVGIIFWNTLWDIKCPTLATCQWLFHFRSLYLYSRSVALEYFIQPSITNTKIY